jgi:glucosamine kinase
MAHDLPSSQDLYYLGVDGGGSKTLAVVVDAQGKEQGRGQGGSSNYAAVGLQASIQSIRVAIEQATANRFPLHKAWLGIAGIDCPEHRELIFPYLRSLANSVRLTNDADLLLSALYNTVGVALIAGTGSIALGRDASGKTTRAGGWGHLIGDEGSGYDLGRQGLQAAVRAADGRGAPTILLDLILKHWDIQSTDDIFGQIYPNENKSKIARLSTLVFQAAREGDHLAHHLVRRGANELALTALTVANALDLPPEIPLALGGGLFIHETDFRTLTLHAIQRHRPTGQVAIVEEPALSAARALIHQPDSVA